MTPLIPTVVAVSRELRHIRSKIVVHTEGGILSTDTNDQHVEGHLGVGDFTLDLGVVADVDDALLVVDLGGLGFVEFHVGLLLAQDVADGLHDGAVLDQTGGTRGQQGSEQEVVSGGDDDDIVVLSVELLEERNGTPSST